MELNLSIEQLFAAFKCMCSLKVVENDPLEPIWLAILSYLWENGESLTGDQLEYVEEFWNAATEGVKSESSS